MLQKKMLNCLKTAQEIGAEKPRANNKMKAPAYLIGTELEKAFPEGYRIWTQGRTGGELSVPVFGFDEHNADITVAKEEKNIAKGVMELKYAQKSYGRNFYTDINNLWGEMSRYALQGIVLLENITWSLAVPALGTREKTNKKGETKKTKIISEVNEINDEMITTLRTVVNKIIETYNLPDMFLITLIDNHNTSYLLRNKGKKYDPEGYKKSIKMSYADLDNLEHVKDPENIAWLKKHSNIDEQLKLFVNEIKKKEVLELLEVK